jgi:hypothetical protein
MHRRVSLLILLVLCLCALAAGGATQPSSCGSSCRTIEEECIAGCGTDTSCRASCGDDYLCCLGACEGEFCD